MTVLSGIVFVQLGEISLMTKVLRSDENESEELTVKLKSYRHRVAWIVTGLICVLLIYSVDVR